MATGDSGQDFKSIGDALGAYKDIFNLPQTLNRIYDGINQINKGLGESRLRAVEFSNAITDSAPGLVRIGVDLNEIGGTIMSIAEGSRRNVIETTETITELAAAAKLVGEATLPSQLVESFQQVGFETSTIAENVAESVGYVQSIGLNSRKIMGDVVRDMEMMNRFNFSDGVVGFTKMAAQASMLRFNMSTTAKFADDVMNPDGAIKMASAFQRLGIMAGDLVDPFVLMDKSINDPGGLQDSLINMTKQFVLFDEKTQSFKIAPGAQRQLREIAGEIGISAEEMKKTALAAADMDRRLSQINLSIRATDEEKMLVANMAKMGTGQFKGDYVVQVKNAQGQEEIKRLSELQAEDFEKLRELQESAPKTAEEYAKAQLGVLEDIQRDIAAYGVQLGYSIAGQNAVIRSVEASKRGSENFFNALYSKDVLGSAEDTRKFFQVVGDDFKDLLVKAAQGDTSAMQAAQDRLEQNVKQIESGTFEKFTKLISKLGIEDPRSKEESLYNQLVEKAKAVGLANMEKEKEGKTKTTTNDVNVNGQIRFVIDAPSGVDTRRLTEYVESPQFRVALSKVLLNIEETGTKSSSSRTK